MKDAPEPGTFVYLRWCPYGSPGMVTGFLRGRVTVEWRDLGMTGRHAPESLILALTHKVLRQL